MALTRLSGTVLPDTKMALFYAQITRSLPRQTSLAETHNYSLTNHWRTRNHQQPHHRTFSHLTRSHDCLMNSHMTNASNHLLQRTCFLLSPPASTNPQPSIQRRCISVKVSGIDNPYVYIPTPVESVYELLEHIHESSAIPWWLTIIATTFLLRGVVVLPFSIWQQSVLARIENVQPEINAHAEYMKQQISLTAKELNWSKKEMSETYGKQVKLIVNKLHFDKKCQSRKIFYVGFMQMGVWTSLTIAIGQMTGKYPELFSAEPNVDYLPELTTQGALWFSDLTQTDLLIPVMLGMANLALVELWSLRRGPLTLLQHRLVNWFRLISLGMIPIATMMPAAVSFYWLTSSLAGLTQFALLRWTLFRRVVDIAPSPSEMKHPLKEMKQAFKIRYFSKKVF